jgi:hypothetical protein
MLPEFGWLKRCHASSSNSIVLNFFGVDLAMTDIDHKKLADALEAPLIPYYISLGRFLTAYAQVEANVLVALRMCSGVANEVGQSLFSGVRAIQALDYIKRIADAQGWNDEKRAPIKIVTDQLGEVTRVRNDVLHYGTETTGLPAERYSTNAFVAHTKDRIRETRITPEILNDLALDCYKLSSHIVMIGSIPNPDFERVAAETLSASWRYKREPPKFPQRKPS